MTTWNFVETALYLAQPGGGNSGYLTYDIGIPLTLPFYAPSAIALVNADNGTFTFDSPSFTVHLPSNPLVFNPSGGLHLSTSFTFSDTLSGNVDLLSVTDALVMRIVNNITELGYAASDAELLGCHSQCLFSGYWQPVTHTPEPGFLGIALIAAALIATALSRLRKSPLSL